MRNSNLLHAAMTSLLAVGAASVAMSASAEEAKQEQCAGVIKAGKNDCATSTNACHGHVDDGQPSGSVDLPAGRHLRTHRRRARRERRGPDPQRQEELIPRGSSRRRIAAPAAIRLYRRRTMRKRTALEPRLMALTEAELAAQRKTPLVDSSIRRADRDGSDALVAARAAGELLAPGRQLDSATNRPH